MLHGRGGVRLAKTSGDREGEYVEEVISRYRRQLNEVGGVLSYLRVVWLVDFASSAEQDTCRFRLGTW